jgi:uncharacterized glyoxalase superfamily protein PhnB
MNKAKITRSASVLLVRDVVSSSNWYKEKLGFEIEGLYGNPISFCILERDNQSLMLCNAPADKILPNRKIVKNIWNVYYWVDDVEKICEEFKISGATIDYELCIKPYGVKEFGIIDPDGYDIAFGQIMREGT